MNSFQKNARFSNSQASKLHQKGKHDAHNMAPVNTNSTRYDINFTFSEV